METFTFQKLLWMIGSDLTWCLRFEYERQVSSWKWADIIEARNFKDEAMELEGQMSALLLMHLFFL